VGSTYRSKGRLIHLLYLGDSSTAFMISWTLTLWVKFPLAYKKRGDRLSVFISQKEMDPPETREELMRLVELRFAGVGDNNTENDRR